MGLFLGASVITVFELFDTFFYSSRRGKSKQEKKGSATENGVANGSLNPMPRVDYGLRTNHFLNNAEIDKHQNGLHDEAKL